MDPENKQMIIDHTKNVAGIPIIDNGYNKAMTQGIGTPQYWAPEARQESQAVACNADQIMMSCAKDVSNVCPSYSRENKGVHRIANHQG
eukprot:3630666-Amphidinium_carterae.1